MARLLVVMAVVIFASCESGLCSGSTCSTGSTDLCCIPPTGDLHLSGSRTQSVAIAPLSQVRRCLVGVAKMPAALRAEVVQSLQLKLDNLYAFLDVARDSLNSTPCQVPYAVHQLAYNSVPAFNAAQQEPSTLGFYQALTRAFRGFNDAHTRLFSPLQVFHYIRPMVLSSRVKTLASGANVQEVYLAAVNPLFSLLNVTTILPQTVLWEDFIGRSIAKINGQDALAYLEGLASQYGFHKSPGVRFNQLLKQKFFSLGEHDIPPQDTEIYTTDDGAELIAQLVAVVTDPRLTVGTSQVSLFMQSRDNVVLSNVTRSVVLTDALTYDEALDLYRQESTLALRPLNVSLGNAIVAFEVNKAIILKFPGRSGLSTSNSLYIYELMETFLKLSRYATKNGIDTILFDVIGTNGGILSFTNWLLGALVGDEYQKNPSRLCETYDVRNSPLWTDWADAFALKPWAAAVASLGIAQMEEIFEMILTRKSDFLELFNSDLSSFYITDVEPKLVAPLEEAMKSSTDQNKQLIQVRQVIRDFFIRPPYSLSTRNIEWYPMLAFTQPIQRWPPYENLTYYRQPRTFKRGGITAQYTQPFLQDCVRALAGTSSLWTPPAFKNIYFLTDGTCGGACALLLSKLQVENKAKVVSIGGIRGQPMDTSFAGGFVENWPEEFEQVRLSEFLGNVIFRSNITFPTTAKLPVPATFTIAAFELYLQGLGQCALPRDWYSIPAQVHLDTWATNADNWPTPDHQFLRQLYVGALKSVRPPTQAPPSTRPPTTPPSSSSKHGLTGGELTAVLIVCIFTAVFLAILGYVYVRKYQKKPLLLGEQDMVGAALLDDTAAVNVQDGLWPDQE